MTILYRFNESGFFASVSIANKCQITGVDLIPSNATLLKPLGASEGSFDIFDGVKWGIFKPEPVAEPTIEQQRAGMVISNAQARLKLIKLGLFDAIDKAIMAMPRNEPIYVLWEYGTNFHRTDEHLTAFCTDTLKMTAEEIDALFM